MTDRPDAVHMIHIAAPAQKVWDALIGASKDYFFGNHWTFGPEGGDFEVIQPDGAINSNGKVLVRDEPRRLRVTWNVVVFEDLKTDTPGEVEWVIEDLGEVTRLTVNEYNRPPQMAAYENSARQGWSLILSGLKTLAETGKPMPAVQPEPPE